MLVLSIVRNVRIFKPDILLSFLAIPSIVSILANIFLNIPHIASERSNPILLPGQSRFWQLLRYLLYSRLNCLVVQSAVLRSMYADILLYPPPINVIKNAITLPVNNQNLNRTFSSSSVKFLYVGRIEYEKGIDL